MKRGKLKVAKARNNDLTETARLWISCRTVKRTVQELGLTKAFEESQTCKGYARACESWHQAFWRWVDEETPADLAKAIRPDWSKIGNRDWPIWELRSLDGTVLKRYDWRPWCIEHRDELSELPCSPAERKLLILELALQEVLVRLALFEFAMRGAGANDPEVVDLFLRDAALAQKVGFSKETYSTRYSKQGQRKQSADKGDRRLKQLLLFYWIPACLWALTNDGIAAFLDKTDPRERGLYMAGTIKDAHSELKLHHKVHWWGLTGDPPALVPLK